MISLFLDTSSSYLNTAVIKDDKVLKNVYVFLEKDMSKDSLLKIKGMLDELNIKPSDIDEIICVNGPGSYTGLRVGVTIAKVFAWGLNKKLVPISSLFTMATSIKDKDYIIPIIDARRNCFFAGIYDKNYNCILNDTYISKEELIKEIEKLNGSYDFVSTNIISGMETIKYSPDISNLMKNIKKEYINPHNLVPNYLKKTEAEENLND